MNKMHTGLIAVSLSAMAFHASAQQRSVGHIDGYYIPNAEIELSAGPGTAKDDGDGFGVKGRALVADQVFLHGEYQSVEYDSNLELDQLRAGLGLFSPLNSTTNLVGKVEYINAELDAGPGSDDENGFGVHGGAEVGLTPEISLVGTVGYVDIGDANGPEFLIGGRLQPNPNLSVFADYRITQLSDGGADLDLDDLRLGVGFHF